MKIGYARISTSGQDTYHQEVALKKVGCEKIFCDQMSGSVDERPGLRELLEFARKGDSIVVFRLDRLARSLPNLIQIVKTCEEMGVALQSLHENLDTSSAGGRLIFHIFGALAEFERDLIRERTISGLEAARKRGRVGGRPARLSSEEKDLLNRLYKTSKISPQEICKRFGISRATYYRALGKEG